MYLMEFGAFIGAIFSKKLRQQVKGQAKTFYILHKYIKKDDRVVWVHAASLGEFEQGRLLMELIRRRHPEFKILLTFFSPSGYEVRKDYEGADVICYLPFDTPGNAASFLRLAHPDVGIFIKYEFWANYLLMARHKKIPMYSVSSIFRPSQHFFRWYGNKAPLRCFTHFFVQNEESKQLLAGIGQSLEGVLRGVEEASFHLGDGHLADGSVSHPADEVVHGKVHQASGKPYSFGLYLWHNDVFRLQK